MTPITIHMAVDEPLDPALMEIGLLLLAASE